MDHAGFPSSAIESKALGGRVAGRCGRGAVEVSVLLQGFPKPLYYNTRALIIIIHQDRVPYHNHSLINPKTL